MSQPHEPTALPPPALGALQRCCPVLVLSVDADGYARSTYSWAVAVGKDVLRFGVDGGGATDANLTREGRVSIQLIGEGGMNLLLRGPVCRLPSNPLALGEIDMRAWQMRLAGQQDQAWLGVRTSALRYHATESAAETALRELEARIGLELLVPGCLLA